MTYRRDRPRLPAAERRRQIVDVTTRLVSERGFWGLSMQDVADGCGLTVPGLLHHVGSKDGLLIAVLDQRDEEDMRWLAAELEERPEAGSLREACTALVRRNSRQSEIVRLFAVLEAESLTPSHPAHDYFVDRQRRTIDGLARLAKGRAPDPVRLARAIAAMMDGLQIQWLRNPSEIDLVAEWEAAAELLFAGCDPPGTDPPDVGPPDVGPPGLGPPGLGPPGLGPPGLGPPGLGPPGLGPPGAGAYPPDGG